MTTAGNTSSGFLRSELEKHCVNEGHFNLHLRKNHITHINIHYIGQTLD